MSKAMKPSRPSGGAGIPRPAQVTVAAVLLIVAAAAHLLLALDEFTTARVIPFSVPTPAIGPHWLLGMLDVVFVGTFIYAGVEVWHERRAGNIKGLVIATSSTLRWLLHFPMAPAASVMVILVNLAIISCLWAQSAYFRSLT